MSQGLGVEEFGCLIIGGQGASLATRLACGGLRTAVVERAGFGGTCVNRGCTPTKTLIAFDDGRILAERILHGRKRSVRERILIWTVFMDPQLGRVGLCEAEARARGLSFDIARIEMKDLARPLEAGEPRGFWKVLVERPSGQILGGSFLSLEGGEMAALCLVAMVSKLPYHTLRDLPISHPTLAESWNNLFLKLDRDKPDRDKPDAQNLAR